MPLTEKGQEIMHNMEKQYGEKKGEKVFYASKNAGTISGVDGAADVAVSNAGGPVEVHPTGPGDKPMSAGAHKAVAMDFDAIAKQFKGRPVLDAARQFAQDAGTAFNSEGKKVGGITTPASEKSEGRGAAWASMTKAEKEAAKKAVRGSKDGEELPKEESEEQHAGKGVDKVATPGHSLNKDPKDKK